ncbi:HAMP domain-containing histidine kinase [Beggiatoa alba]|nr:HAMP domain-containing histidine kinase [Beggiatoa alba]
MRIQTNIFLWGFLAFVVPLTALALIATYYSQASYLTDVKQNVNHNLVVLSAEIKRQLSAERALTYGLSQAPAVQEFLIVLDKIEQQQIPPDFDQKMNAISRFFEGFQTIIPGTFFIRILDSHGNTLVKVSHKQRSQPIYESLQGFSYVEQELQNPDFVNKLKSLVKNQVHALVLPHNKAHSDLFSHLSLLDNVIPLYVNNKWVGALSLTIVGENIDKILTHAMRPFDGHLLIAENNPDIANRHGMVLYDDAQKLLFSYPRPNPVYLQNTDLKPMLNNIIDADDSVYPFKSTNSTFHYIEMTPYQNQFVSWLLAINIPNTTINQPYAKIRITIWTVAAITLLIGLLLTQIGARRVTRALSALVHNFKAYAEGDHTQIAITGHCVDEIKDLGNAFNEMTRTLNIAHQDRDKAQQMMLQSSKLASIGQMAAGIGHEINNPLNNILSYAKLALRNLQSLSAEQLSDNRKKSLQSDLQSLREETLRASEIVKGIMNFARQVPPHFIHFEITHWLENSIALVQQSANAKSLTLNLDCHLDTKTKLKGDRSQLQQVLVNLLLNAIQASDNRTKINITATLSNTHFSVSIIDNGSGILAHDLSLIFDPFFTTKAPGQGTGLGLSISLGIIQDHQGQLDVQNRETSNGVIAKITLPLST